jgi:hypothetical protein
MVWRFLKKLNVRNEFELSFNKRAIVLE